MRPEIAYSGCCAIQFRGSGVYCIFFGLTLLYIYILLNKKREQNNKNTTLMHNFYVVLYELELWSRSYSFEYSKNSATFK